MRAAGDLGDDVAIKVERGARDFASGDRIIFLRNERSLEVKNGTLGTVERVSEQSMTVRTDDGRSVAFDMKDYVDLDHGYAATIHKAQGMTIDCNHVGTDEHPSELKSLMRISYAVFCLTITKQNSNDKMSINKQH